WCLRSQGHIPLSDLIVTEKAKSFAKLLNIPDNTLTFSSGYQLHGEKALPDLKAIINSFRPECVYNMDETGLFFRQVYNTDKEHLTTVVLCCNADGTDKLPLLIIVKYLKPRCMKNVNMNNLALHIEQILKHG
ncbi:8318_t:CDS:2, partial [Entrophospora sp. SA101]